VKIYLDTNILSNIVGLKRITKKTGVALQKLALSNHEFVTSQLMEMEMKKATDPKVKGAILFVYKMFGKSKKLNNETYYATGLGDALVGTVPWGGGQTENTVLSLLKQNFEPNDARHIFQALSSHSDYFLTLDENSILKKYRANHQNIKSFCDNGNMKIVNPIELVTELGLQSSE